MTLDEAKRAANNTSARIRPINNNGEQSPYSFSVVNNIVYDAKDRVENEQEWDGYEFTVE